MIQYPPTKFAGFLPAPLIKKLEELCLSVERGETPYTHDRSVYHRKFIRGHALAEVIHYSYVLPFAEKAFGEKLVPAYNFLSMYDMGKGLCPYHSDKDECYRTVDVCVSQSQIWPIYATELDRVHTEAELMENVDEFKKNGQRFDLVPGDALFLAGVQHPHWRNPLPAGNFCNMIFFHFLPASSKS
jgi:hypothetical protein